MRYSGNGFFKDSSCGLSGVDYSRILVPVVVRWILPGFLVRSWCGGFFKDSLCGVGAVDCLQILNVVLVPLPRGDPLRR